MTRPIHHDKQYMHKLTLNVPKDQKSHDLYWEILRERSSGETPPLIVSAQKFIANALTGRGHNISCGMPDCDGTILLDRDQETLALKDTCKCLLCGQRYNLVDMGTFNEGYRTPKRGDK